MIEKLKSRLSRWKGRLLSLAEKICLIKFVLSSIPLFYMSLFKLSVVILKEIVRIQRHFFIGVGVGRKEDRLGFLKESL